jgi:hypothetical protein
VERVVLTRVSQEAVMHRAYRFVVAVLIACATLFASRLARAKDVEIVAVMWQQDLSAKATVEQFFGCLTTSSSFTPTWAPQFGLTSVTFKGVYVVPTACPTTVAFETDVPTLMSAAFASGAVPAPSAGYKTSYILYLPSGTTASAMSMSMCGYGEPCGYHSTVTYQGDEYDAALVPIDCNSCGSAQVTGIGEHEAAEAIADMGTATYEVGDGCENQQNHEQLACCGTEYPIQQLAGPGGMSDCQSIVATGSMCGAPPPVDAGVDAPPDAATAGVDAGDVARDAGMSSGGEPDAATGSTGGAADAASGGPPRGDAALTGEAGGASAGDEPGESPMQSCACSTPGGGARGAAGWAPACVVAALVACARIRRRPVTLATRKRTCSSLPASRLTGSLPTRSNRSSSPWLRMARRTAGLLRRDSASSR